MSSSAFPTHSPSSFPDNLFSRNETSQSHKKGLSSGGLVGVVFGSFFVITVLILLISCYSKRKRSYSGGIMLYFMSNSKAHTGIYRYEDDHSSGYFSVDPQGKALERYKLNFDALDPDSPETVDGDADIDEEIAADLNSNRKKRKIIGARRDGNISDSTVLGGGKVDSDIQGRKVTLHTSAVTIQGIP